LASTRDAEALMVLNLMHVAGMCWMTSTQVLEEQNFLSNGLHLKSWTIHASLPSQMFGLMVRIKSWVLHRQFLLVLHRLLFLTSIMNPMQIPGQSNAGAYILEPSYFPVIQLVIHLLVL